MNETHCGHTLQEIKKLLNLKVVELHYTFDGVRGVFTDTHGESYEIIVKPKEVKDELH